MVTMKKIAELCGVSRGTVDRALNGRGRVNAETAENIRKMAKQLGYEPNPAGKALAARKNRPVIGIILSAEGNAFFDRVIDGIKDAAEEYKIYGLQVEIHTMKGYLPEDQLALIESIQADINALILNPINDKRIVQKIDELVDAGVFVVNLNNDVDGSKRHCYVGSDYYNGGITACALLEAMIGTSAKVGLILGSRQVLGHKQRLEGFLHRMERVKDFYAIDVIEHEDDEIFAYERTKEFLRSHPETTAICSLAAGVYGIGRAVMQLPEEKRPMVIAFDSVPTTVEMMKFGVVRATIYQHPYRQGHLAVDIAFAYLVNGRLPEKREYIMKNEIRLLENL